METLILFAGICLTRVSFRRQKVKKKRITLLLVAMLTLSALFTGCSNADLNNDSSSNNQTVDTGSWDSVIEQSTTGNEDLNGFTVEYSDKDKDSTYDESTATIITLSDGNSSVDGDGATASANTVTINQAGTYVVSGTLSDGQLIVDATTVDTVQIVLNNVNITCDDGSAIYVKQAEKAIITLASDSKNTISDGSNYASTGDEDPDAAIYAGDDLTINGSGTLVVNGNYKHGIKTVDDLVVTGGKLVITAVEEGMRGKDSVSILDGDITINAGGNGIKSNNDEEDASGWVSIDGGTFNIEAENNGIQTQTGMLITSGKFNITTTNDALHCNGSIWISGGDITLTAGDDGIHADNYLAVTDGTIKVLASYEGLEGANIAIGGGSISVEADDDGLNAAGGSDGDMMPGDNFNDTGSYTISIGGGSIYVNAGGDGVDSNGSIALSDGTVVVNGPEDNGNCAIDFDTGSFTVSGGTLIAIGSSGMLASPTQASQPVVTILYDSTQTGDDIVTITNSEGALFSIDPLKTYTSIMISSPELSEGSTYNVLYGGAITGQTVDDTLYTDATVSGETSTASFTLSDSILFIDPDGNITEYSGGMGGGMNGGRDMNNDMQGGGRGAPVR